MTLRKTALCAGVVLLVGMIATGVWTEVTRPMPWPFEVDANQPRVDMVHQEEVDFAFRTGDLVPVSLYVALPPGMSLEPDLSCKGDMTVASQQTVRERQRDRSTRYRVDLQLQSLTYKGNAALPPQNAWVAHITLTYSDASGKAMPLKVEPIIVFTSKTYDGRKEKFGREPHVERLTDYPHLAWSIAMVAVGCGGMLWCLVLVWPRRKPVPQPAVVQPPKPVDPWTVFARAYDAVLENAVYQSALVDGVDETMLEEQRQLRETLALAARRYFGLSTVTWEELQARGTKKDAAIADVLRVCEDSAIWGNSTLTPGDINALAEAWSVLVEARRPAA